MPAAPAPGPLSAAYEELVGRADWTIVTIRERSRRYIQYDPASPHLVDEPIAR
jgi:hypothetical protein